jgi:hypothetical protein
MRAAFPRLRSTGDTMLPRTAVVSVVPPAWLPAMGLAIPAVCPSHVSKASPWYRFCPQCPARGRRLVPGRLEKCHQGHFPKSTQRLALLAASLRPNEGAARWHRSSRCYSDCRIVHWDAAKYSTFSCPTALCTRPTASWAPSESTAASQRGRRGTCKDAGAEIFLEPRSRKGSSTDCESELKAMTLLRPSLACFDPSGESTPSSGCASLSSRVGHWSAQRRGAPTRE